ncbi:hypothetical protein GCM10025868_22500 [Angustibacter aerolatus]|uniref:Uncharacterized protein n=1 Tax=Angustibacter aerolatus TaxID=1162965 RepID=A0ABQ6JFP1_9ACTN|nr:hypothetical protein GCM10025868_22500 [Angustibacter aerolatus]
MTYDYFGAFAPQGPTAPHSPLTSYPGIPTQGFDSATAIAKPAEPRRPGEQDPARRRVLRPRLDRRHAVGAGRFGHRPGARHVRAGHRGLQGAQDQVPGERHGGRHRLLHRLRG